jgi:carbamoylphosphate synthase small subunit
MVLLLDNFDSFTWNLKDYLCQEGAEVQVIRNNEINQEVLEGRKWQGLVISPGPGRPQDVPVIHQMLEHFASKIPVLGICLGHQAIGTYFGASLVKASQPMHGKLSEIIPSSHAMFEGFQYPHYVCRYHSLLLHDPWPVSLEVTATTKSGEIMALAHKQWPIWGVQYHPEAILTENGHTLLRNWLKLVYLQL